MYKLPEEEVDRFARDSQLAGAHQLEEATAAAAQQLHGSADVEQSGTVGEEANRYPLPVKLTANKEIHRFIIL